MARPRIEIDKDQVYKLAERHWTNVEIGAFFGVNEGTIRKGYSDILAKGRAVGKGKLRDLQWKAAIGGNTSMLIWLGKQHLDQKDQPLINQSNHEHFKVEVKIDDENKTAQESGNRISQYVEV